MELQAADSKHAAEESRDAAVELRHALSEMRQSLSTRYLARFPLYFKDIVALIDTAQERIDIFCDVPAYGSVSNPKYFRDYRTKLKEKLAQLLTIEITCLSKERRSALFKEQFLGDHADWERKKHSNPHYAGFLEAHGKRSQLDSLTPDTFLGMVEEEDNLMLNEFLSGAKISQTKAHVPIYFWLIDEREAIFAIPSLAEGDLEHGFKTTDSSLIRAFKSMRNLYNSSPDLLAAAPAPRLSV